MKILVIGGTGIIGKSVADLLKKEHDVITIGKNGGDYQLDIENKASIEKMFEDFKDVDGVISTTGMANFAPLKDHTDADFELAINNKLMGQVNLARVALNQVKENGFIILTTGSASYEPMPGSASITMASAGVEGFVKAANLEKEKNIRINVVRPAAVVETLEALGMSFPNAVSAYDTARVYKAVTELNESGQMYNMHECLELINDK